MCQTTEATPDQVAATAAHESQVFATQVEKTERTYTIPSSKRYAAQEILAKLNRKAAKLGAAPILHSFSEPWVFTIREASSGFVSIEPITIEVVTLTVSTALVRLSGGWRIAAVVEAIAEDDGTVLNYLSGPHADKCVAYRSAKPVCAHCKTTRFRKLTFCLMNDAEEIIQVGSTCLSDFLGVNPASAVAGLQLFCEIDASFSDEESFGLGGGGCFDRTLPLARTVLMAVAVIRLHGYRNKNSCAFDESPTWDEVSYQLTVRWNKDNESRKIIPTEADEKQAAEVLAKWNETAERAKAQIAAGQDPSDWDFKLYALVKAGYIKTEPKFFAFATGAVAGTIGSIARALERAAKEVYGPSEFYGEVGERMTIDFEIERTKSFESEWGTRVLLAGRIAKTCHKIVLWTGSSCDEKFGFKIGETFTISAKIKAHTDDPKWGKQTTIQRPTFAKKTLTKDDKKRVKRLKALIKRLNDRYNTNPSRYGTMHAKRHTRWTEAIQAITTHAGPK